MSYANVLSTLAILMSAGALTWQVILNRRNVPRVSLTSGLTWHWEDERESGGNLRGEIILYVSVTNTGYQAVTIRDVYWDVFLREDAKPGSWSLKRENMGPAVPCRLDGHDVLRWEMRFAPDDKLVSGRLRLRPVGEAILPSGPITMTGEWETLGPPPFPDNADAGVLDDLRRSWRDPPPS